MDAELPPLMRGLLAPQAYAHAVDQVALEQTHISWVLLAGDYAYKIKKPVRLPFLDFSTLALRLQACQDELRLNRRYAAELYLDVVPVVDTPQGPRLEAQGTPIEYALKMRRFDSAARLDKVAARGELTPAHLSGLAQQICALHQQAEPAPADSAWGRADTVMAAVRENFTDLLPLADTLPDASALDALRNWSESAYLQLHPQFEARRQAGFVREGHGDLHLGNLLLRDGRVQMFDCIEFNAALRWIDIASELAFPYVDLLAHGQPGLAGWLLNEVWSRNGDYESAALLRFYAVYRALVRAKVAAIRLQQTPQEEAPRHEVARYVALAARLADTPPLRLILTHGVSGCGKTWLGDRLLQRDARARTVRLRSDVERKRLFGLAADARSGSATGSGIYSRDAGARTYARLHALAASLLQAGWSVLVDATFLRRADRTRFRALAQTQGATYAILAPQASPQGLRERILARQAQGQDASEATLDVLARQLQQIEALDAEERACALDLGALTDKAQNAPR